MSKLFLTSEPLSQSSPTSEQLSEVRACAQEAKAFWAKCAPDAVYARMLQGTGCRTQAELAILLGISRAEIADALRTGDFPEGCYQRLFFRCSLFPSWLMLGIGWEAFPWEMPPRDSLLGAKLEQWVCTCFCLCREIRTCSTSQAGIATETLTRYDASDVLL